MTEKNNSVLTILSKIYTSANKFIWGSLLLSLTIFLFIPLDLYINNPGEFNAGVINIVLSCGLWVLALTVALALVGSFIDLIHYKIGNVYIIILFILSIGFWMQAFILMGNYGNIDGHDIIWSDYSFYLQIEVVIWILAVILITTLRRKIISNIKNTALILIIYQIIVCITIAVSSDSKITLIANNIEFDYSLSKDKNVIILVLDTFSGETFQEIINGDNEYADYFDGFTFFPDALGGYPTTIASVPLILTGEYYENLETYQEFLTKKSDKSILNFLEQHNFNVTSNLGSFYAPILNESKEIYRFFLKKSEKESILTMVGIKIFPSRIKKYFFDNYSAQKYQLGDLKFMNDFIREIDDKNNKPTFRYIHLGGNHPAYVMNENLEIDLGMGDQGMIRQGKGALKVAYNILKALKDEDLYDDTLIFILGDHGDGGFNSLLMPRTNPLFLFKNFSERGSLKLNNLPVSLADINSTVLDILQLKNEYHGNSIVDIDNFSLDKVRTYYYYNWSGDYHNWSQAYIPPSKKYLVIGSYNETSSWIDTMRTYTKDGLENTGFDLGQKLFFYDAQMEKQLMGFHGITHEGRWTNGNKSRIVVPLSTIPIGDIELNFNMSWYISHDVYSDVYVNGVKIGTITPDFETFSHTFSIENELLKYENVLIIDLDIPATYGEFDMGLLIREISVNEFIK